jgi:aspartate carbamoyltransferase regulatory subunit
MDAPIKPAQQSINTVSKHIIETGKKYVEKSNDSTTTNNNNNNNNKKYKIFIVSADIQNDIYNLVEPDTTVNDLSNYDISNKLIASIPDYKTSVFMNTLFRNIK